MARTFLIIAALVGGAGCSLAFDFEDIDDLPCDASDQCREDFICRLDTRDCIRRGSVDPGKSCGIAVEGDPDNLCPEGYRCVDVAGRGLRCLLPCTPVVPIDETAGLALRDQCGPNNYCWSLPTGGGACDEGECQELGNQGCPVGSQCVELNSAGKCFAQCDIYSTDGDCIDGACHPVDQAVVNACIAPGDLDEGDKCDGVNWCRAFNDDGSPLICARPEGATSRDDFCRILCDPTLQIGCPGGTRCVRIEGSGALGSPVDVGICSQ